MVQVSRFGSAGLGFGALVLALVPAVPATAVGTVDVSGGSAGSTVAAVEPQVVLGQRVERQVTLYPRRSGRVSSKGVDLFEISALGSFDVPEAAMRAYRNAASAYASSCGLDWALLAGIGRVESDHGRYGGSVLGSDGVPRPAIIGIALDGHGPVAAIRDSDGGRYDGDRVWDRAVGPMQFIPGTWAWVGRDGDGDGTADPQDLDDAAMAAASYLCRAGAVSTASGAAAAVYRYNQSDYYVALVLAFAEGYRTGVFTIPSPPPASDPAHAQKPGKNGGKHAQHDGKNDGDGGGKGQGSASSSGTKPHDGTGGSSGGTPTPPPAPTPEPTPTPAPSPAVVSRSGTWSSCGSGWCIGGVALDVGPGDHLGAQAAFDYDGDGATETNRDELTGLEGRDLTVAVREGGEPMMLMTIAGHEYRDADGTLR